MLPPRGAEVLDRFLRRQDQAEHVEVELLVEVLGGHVFQRSELVDAGVVDQDVEPCRTPSSPRQTAARCRPAWRRSACTATALPPLPAISRDDAVGPLLAGGVVDDDRGAFGGQVHGDRGPDPLRCARDDGDFARKFLGHDSIPFLLPMC